MRDVAELLEIPPAQVLDTLTFYTHFWSHPKGKKVIVSCRSLSCELMGAREVNEAIAEKLGVGEHGTSTDGVYSFVTEECLGACEHAPCLLVGEKLHKCVKPDQVAKILADPDNSRLDVPRSTLYDAPTDAEPASPKTNSPPVEDDEIVGSTSDVQEMKDS
jgi:NADH-quinone oxidoreductase subunit E